MSAGPSSSPPQQRRHDLRLFGAAGGMWLATVVALYGSAAAAWWIAFGAAMGATLIGVVNRARLSRTAIDGRIARRPVFASGPGTGRHRSDGRGTRTASRMDGSGIRTALAWATVAVLLGILCGALSTASRVMARDAQPLADLTRRHASGHVEVTVTDDPKVLHTTGAGPTTYLIAARLTRIEVAEVGTVRLDARVIIFATDVRWRGMLPSQRVASTARLGPARGGDLTAATITATGQPEPLDRPSWTQLAAGRLRAGLQAACLPLPPDPGGLLPGLVIGDTSRLDPALEEEFRITGLTHLVAVSGANLAIVLGVVLFAARWCRAGPWLSAGICALAVAGFVILARPSPSVVRAAAMGGVGLLALASGRTRAATAALAVAVVVGLLVDPALAVDAGFALSVLATGALVLLAPRWTEALRSVGVPGGLAEALAVPAAAQVVCGPIIVALSGQVSVVAIPANLLAAPAVAPATLLGVGSAVLSPLWADGAELLAWLASWPARWLVGLAKIGAGVPLDVLPWPSGAPGAILLTAFTVGLWLAARRRPLRRLVLVAALAIVVGAVPVRWVAPGWPPAGAVVVACDVGQGDALVLPTARHEAIVVDAGPDPVAVDGCLRRLGIRAIPALIFTHFHVDHVAGIIGVLRDRTVSEVVVPRFAEPAAGHNSVVTASGAAAIPVLAVGAGWSLEQGQVRLQVIGPASTLTGTRSDPNNNSLLVRAVSGGVSILLIGDAETEEQAALLRHTGPTALRVDVLKVAHHGSLYQDPELLDAVDPAVALVSVGEDNPYGHPNPAVLDRLARSGARVFRTDRDGDVAVVAHDGEVAVALHGPS